MSAPITIWGRPAAVKAKLLLLLNILRNREASGWAVLGSDEEWDFVDARDFRVESQCLALRGNIYRGNRVMRLFPNASAVSAIVLKANVHPNCRCHLVWVNVNEVLTNRLISEGNGALIMNV